MDLAVGIIIGAAFTAIVGSLVSDLINPIIGLILGGVDFTNMYLVLKGTVPDGASLQAARDAGAAAPGQAGCQDRCQRTLNDVRLRSAAIINFLIIAFVVFMLIRMMNKIMPKKAEAPAAPAGPTEVDLLKDILVALKK